MSSQFFKSENFVDLDRAGIVESSHYGHLILLNENGEVIAARGDQNALVYPRSAIKAIQASAMVRAGLKLEPRLLALVCASHAGSQMHIDAVEEILRGSNLGLSNLKCTPRTPRGTVENQAYGEKAPQAVVADCSGKHAGMLATCVANGWSIENYLDPNHPLQLLIKAELENLMGAKVNNVTVDGCGAPLFSASTIQFTNAFHNLFKSKDPVHQEIFHATTSYPEMVSGVHDKITHLMQKFPGLFIKDGAEGVYVAGYQNGNTLFVKASDGSLRWGTTVLYRALELWDIPTNPTEDEAIFYSYGGGKVLGSMKATF